MRGLFYYAKCLRGYIEIKTRCCGADHIYVSNLTRVSNSGDKKSIYIGQQCCITGSLSAFRGGRIIIGNHCYIGRRSQIGAKSLVEIGDSVIISDDVIIMDNNNHPIEPIHRRKMCESGDFWGELWSWTYADSKPIHIEENVWIGKRAFIMKGVTLGRGSVIGAAAVVTKDVPPFTVVAGNPARVVKTLSKEVSDEKD